MSSLKGQLSNVEGSVKSMKAAVVVGSVLTVACLAAVFGVTILANEVSKEVKVSNNTLTTKAGKPVLAANTVVTSKSINANTVIIQEADFTVNAVITAQVVQGDVITTICDDLILIEEAGSSSLLITEGSVLESVLSSDVEARNLNRRKLIKKAGKWVWWAGKQVAEGIGGAAVWGETWGAIKDVFAGDDPAPSGCKRRSLLMMC